MMQFFIIYVVITLCYSLSIAFAAISPCAIWNNRGVTVGGTGAEGGASDQLNAPEAIFIHKQTNRLYVADTENQRIQMFTLDHLQPQGITVASLKSLPYDIYVDDDVEGPTIYVSLGWDDGRVEKWVNGTSSGVQVGGQCRNCLGVWVDKNKNVYMTETDRERVLKWSPETNISTVVAGRTDVTGQTADLLDTPWGITVDGTNDDLYVSDNYNNRIQKWMKDAKQGITVAGLSNGTGGMDDATLSKPSAVLIDEETKTVYVVDRSNQRIQRWLANAPSGDTIAGGAGKGNASDQFNEPTDLAFDSHGNLYVNDLYNHRVQMFALVNNQPCSSTSTTSATSEPTPTSTTSATSEPTPTSTTSATSEPISTSTTSATSESTSTSETSATSESTSTSTSSATSESTSTSTSSGTGETTPTSASSATSESTSTSTSSGTGETTPTSASNSTGEPAPTSLTSATSESIPTSASNSTDGTTPTSAARPTMIKSTMIIMLFSILIHILTKVV